MAVIGIDLGTTYSAAARCIDGKPEIIPLEGNSTLPSVVGLQRSGNVAIGLTAKRNQARSPGDTIIEVKRLMGEPKAEVKLGNHAYRPQEVSAMILKRIKELAEAELGEPVTGVVISCPAYFKDPARAATEEAGVLAGLTVLKIVNEPTAAAYAYGVREGDDANEKLYLVYDLGGGTFDVTVIRMQAGLLEVIGTGGDPRLGGGDFDDRIVGWMLDKIKADNREYAVTLTEEKTSTLKLRLKFFAEEGKKALCNNPSSDASHQFQIANVDSFQNRPIAFNATLARADFERLIGDLLENSLKCVDEALKVPKEKHNYTEENITAVLLVGGSTRIPMVRQILEKRFPAKVWGQERGINPDEIVAAGASLVAADADVTGEQVGPNSVLVDVTGHSLQVAVWDSRLQRRVLSPIIAKESQIPLQAQHEFWSHGENQTICKIEVWQGEGREIDPQSQQMIGEFSIEIPPKMEPEAVIVGLDLDKNGILVAHATHKSTGRRATCNINYKDSAKLDPKELERRKAQLDALFNRAANPLAGGSSGAGDQPPPTPAATTAPAATVTAAASAPANSIPPAATDPTAGMNPILRMLYTKALNSFMNVPADRQQSLVQLVTEIDAAARAGDKQKLEGYTPQLAKLLEGVA